MLTHCDSQSYFRFELVCYFIKYELTLNYFVFICLPRSFSMLEHRCWYLNTGWTSNDQCLTIQLATRAIEPSFGLLFGDLLRELQVNTLGAAVIMSVYDVMMNFSGLFVGPLLKNYSYRKVAIAGALLCSLGLALTSPASSLAHILTTYSIINGKHTIFLLS